MYAVTPDDATTKTADDTPRLIHTEVPDRPSGLEDEGPIGEDNPDANDRNRPVQQHVGGGERGVTSHVCMKRLVPICSKDSEEPSGSASTS